MAAKGGHIDFMFVGPSPTSPVDPLLGDSLLHAWKLPITSPKSASEVHGLVLVKTMFSQLKLPFQKILTFLAKLIELQ